MADTNALLQSLLEQFQITNNNISQLASRVQSLEVRMSGEKADAASAPAFPSHVLKPSGTPSEEVSTPQVPKKTTTIEYPFTDPPAPSGMDMFGPTGLPNTPHVSSKDIGNENARPNRRHSIHQHGLLEAVKNSSHVITYGVREPYDHIRLKAAQSPRAFIEFFEAVVSHEGEQDPNQRDDIDQNKQFDPGGEKPICISHTQVAPVKPLLRFVYLCRSQGRHH